jgi:uncharacterized protein YebE (UPF0316 family)
MITSLLAHGATSDTHGETIFFLVALVIVFIVLHVLLLDLILMFHLKATEELLDPTEVFELLHGAVLYLSLFLNSVLNAVFFLVYMHGGHGFLKFVGDELSSGMGHV